MKAMNKFVLNAIRVIILMCPAALIHRLGFQHLFYS